MICCSQSLLFHNAGFLDDLRRGRAFVASLDNLCYVSEGNDVHPPTCFHLDQGNEADAALLNCRLLYFLCYPEIAGRKVACRTSPTVQVQQDY
jgi:hypothetical protein